MPEAARRAMACCVVLSRLPADVCKDDVTKETANPPRSTRSKSHQNTGTGTSTSRSAAATVGRPQNATCSKAPADPGEDFKEPWAKLLLQAKARRQSSSRLKNNPKPPSNIEVLKETDASSEKVTAALEQLNSSSTTQSIKDSGVINCKQNEASKRRSRERKVSSTPKRSVKRASSAEWDLSNSESAETPLVPLNKGRKTCKQSKRALSLDGGGKSSDHHSSGKKKSTKNLCHICDKTFPRPSKLRTHLYKHLYPDSPPYACDKEGCSKAYYTSSHLDRHKATSHSNLVVHENLLCTAEGCGRIFISGSGLKRHMNKEHSNEGLKFACPNCDKKFSKSKQLRHHIAEHYGQAPLKCEKCNVGAYSEYELKRHMRGHREFKCDISGCDKIFLKYPLLQKHKAEHNRCFTSLQCAHCGKQFSNKSNLRDHVATHLDNKPVFRCPHDSCPRLYYQERNLNAHIRLRHEKKSSFVCTFPDCGKIFHSKSALTKHINVHKNGKAPMTARKEGPRAVRKDAGKPRRPMATMLTGLKLSSKVEKDLLQEEDVVIISESEPEDNTAHPVVCDYPATRDLLNASELRSTLAKIQFNHSLANEEQDVDIDQDCMKMNSTNIAFSNGHSMGEKNDQTSDNNLVETSVIVEGGENLIASLTGKVFVVGDDGELVEVPVSSQNTHLSLGPLEEMKKTSDSIRDCSPNLDQLNDSIKAVNGSDADASQNHCQEKSIAMESENKQTESVNRHQTNACNLSDGQGNECGDESKNEEQFILEGFNSAAIYSPQQGGAVSSPTLLSSTVENCLLSATLCAETIVECQSSNTEREVLLVIPKTGSKQIHALKEVLSGNNSEAVMKALSGDVDVYSMAKRTSVLDMPLDQTNRISLYDQLKKISIDDPSVSSILKPLIQNLGSNPDKPAKDLCQAIRKLSANHGNNLAECSIISTVSYEQESANSVQVDSTPANKEKQSVECRVEISHITETKSKDEANIIINTNEVPSRTRIIKPPCLRSRKCRKIINKDCSNKCKERSCKKPANRKILNPAYLQSMITKFANLMSNAEPVTSLKNRDSVSVLKTLQGPSQNLPESGNSSSSESDGSQSDDSDSADDYNEWNDEHDEVADHASDGGNGDDEDDEDDNGEEQVEEEEAGEEEDESDDDDADHGNEGDGNNDGAGELNGGHDDNNNNDNSENEVNTYESDQEIDIEARNDHMGDGLDIGVDRATGPKRDVLHGLFSPKPAIFDDSDAGRSVQSDDLVIVEESESAHEDEVFIQDTSNMKKSIKVMSPKACSPTKSSHPSKNKCVDASVKGSPGQGSVCKGGILRESTPKHNSPDDASVKCIRRSSRIRSIEANRAVHQEKAAAVVKAGQGEKLRESDPDSGKENLANMNREKESNKGIVVDTQSETDKLSTNTPGSKNPGRSNIKNGNDFKGTKTSQNLRRIKISDKRPLKDSSGSEAPLEGQQIRLISQPEKSMKKSGNEFESDSSDFDIPSTHKKSGKKQNPIFESDSSDFEPPVKRGKINNSLDREEKKKDLNSFRNGGQYVRKEKSVSPQMKANKKENASDVNFSGPLKSRKRKYVSSESDPDEPTSVMYNFNASDSDDPQDPSWKPEGAKGSRGCRTVKDEDSDTNTSEGQSVLLNTSGIYEQGLQKAFNNFIKVLSSVQSKDPSNSQKAGLVEAVKNSKRRPTACKQLSESSWIDVFRQVCASMKPLVSASEDC